MKILFLVSLAILATTYVQAEFATGDEVALAKQVRICLDMGNTKETCYEKYADKIGQFDPMHFGMVVNYEAVLKELNEFLLIWKEGKTTIRETLAVMKQNQASTQQPPRQKREMPQPIQTLLIFHYFIRQCVAKNPTMNHITCAAAMFGPDLSNLKERVSEFAAKHTESMKEFYESTKGKASDLADSVQGWFSEKFGRRKRDVAGKLNEAKDAVASQLKDVKEALTAYKDLIAACAQQSGQNVFTCTAQLFGPKLEEELTDMKETVQGWFSKLSNRQKRDMPTGDEVALAKQFTICLDMGGSKEDCTKKFAEQLAKYDPVHFNTVVNYEALLKQLNEFFKYYTPGKTTIREAIAAMNQASHQRQKRDMPTQTEIGYAKAIKICLDMGNDKDACYAKVLGANIANVDMVKLQAIANYEEVLKELNQFLPLWNQGERTIREALLLLHQQQAAKKTRAFTTPSAESLMELKTVVLECMNAWPSKDIKKCAIALFGTQIEGSDKLNLVVQLINHPQVQEFAKGAGLQLHTYMQSLDGFMGQLHSWAHGAYEYVYNLFG